MKHFVNPCDILSLLRTLNKIVNKFNEIQKNALVTWWVYAWIRIIYFFSHYGSLLKFSIKKRAFIFIKIFQISQINFWLIIGVNHFMRFHDEKYKWPTLFANENSVIIVKVCVNMDENIITRFFIHIGYFY